MSEPDSVSDLKRSGHTPAPWQACKDAKCPCRQVWSIPGDVPVFTARADAHSLVGMAHHKWGDSPEMIYGEIPEEQAEANARLIAAAPELLAAAKAKLANCEGCDDAALMPGEYCSDECIALAEAIKKAEDRS